MPETPSPLRAALERVRLVLRHASDCPAKMILAGPCDCGIVTANTLLTAEVSAVEGRLTDVTADLTSAREMLARANAGTDEALERIEELEPSARRYEALRGLRGWMLRIDAEGKVLAWRPIEDNQEGAVTARVWPSLDALADALGGEATNG